MHIFNNKLQVNVSKIIMILKKNSLSPSFFVVLEIMSCLSQPSQRPPCKHVSQQQDICVDKEQKPYIFMYS